MFAVLGRGSIKMSGFSFAGKIISVVLVCVLILFVSCDLSFEDEIVDGVNVSVSRALVPEYDDIDYSIVTMTKNSSGAKIVSDQYVDDDFVFSTGAFLQGIWTVRADAYTKKENGCFIRVATGSSSIRMEAEKEYDVAVVIDTFVIPDLTFTLNLPEDFDNSLKKLYAAWTLSSSDGSAFNVDWENAFTLNRTEENKFELAIDADNLTGKQDRLDIGEWSLQVCVADTNDIDTQKIIGCGSIEFHIMPAGDPVEKDVEISLWK